MPVGHTYLCHAPFCTHDPLLMKPRSLPFLLACAIIVSTGCRKDRNVEVPVVPLDIYIDVNLPAYNALAVTGGWPYITGGSEGLIVYRKSPDEFTAMDRHCTYQPEELCRVTVDDSGIIARDTTCCQSAFLMLDGSVTDGPAPLGLKLYHTTFNGSVLHIFN